MAEPGLCFPFPDPQQAGLADNLTSLGEWPLIPVVLGGSDQARLVCGYEEIRKLLTSDDFSRAKATAHGMTARSTESLALNSVDQPDHSRRRATVSAAFTKARVEKERPWIQREAEKLLARLTSAGPPADLIENFSLPLSVSVICRTMGVSDKDFPIFAPLTRVMMSTAGHNPAEIAAAHQGMYDYFSSLYDQERTRLLDHGERHGVLTDLVIAAEQDGKISRTEAIHIAYGLLIAGYETTSMQIATSVLLLSDRALWDQLRDNPSKLRPAIEETMRWTSLLATGGVPHVALANVRVGASEIKAGDVLIPVFAAANRDPRMFTDPNQLRLDRTDTSHVAFGFGRHLCLGAPLARVELEVALGAIMHHLPGLQLAVPERDLRWRQNSFIRGLTALPVRW